MGRKVNPVAFRLGGVKDWESRWYAGRNYTEQLHQDINLRAIVRRRLANASVSRVTIARSGDDVTVNVFTAKPGIVIGKGGATVDALRRELEQFTGRRINLNIEEIRHPETEAQLIAESIGEQINKRVSYKRAMKQAAQRAMRLGAQGVMIKCSGRLGGAEMARTINEMQGRIPRHTLRADIDYAVFHAHTTYGRIGVKVWIYRGEIFPEKAGAIEGREGLQQRRQPVPVPEPERRERRAPGSGRGPAGAGRGTEPRR